tara:strand:- start:1283 stop:1981 length:699 start_codon:yes stop_codon:yes gene_type:complete
MNKNNKPTWFFDTAKGVDHLTKTMETYENITPEEASKMNKETKLGLIKAEEKRLKKFSNEDVSSYPSDPEQKRILTNIDNLEKDLKIRPDTWKRYVRTGALPIVPKGFVSNSDTWEMMKSVGSPKEKREYARMEREDVLKTKREKIKQFREKKAEKDKTRIPAENMAQQIVDAVTVKATNLIMEETPIQTPLYAPPVNRAFTGGLHENFVEEKIRENNILKRIDKEIEDEKI